MSNPPGWINLVVAFAALVSALGVIWKSIGKHAVRFVRDQLELRDVVLELRDMLPWLRELRRAAKNLMDSEEKKS